MTVSSAAVESWLARPPIAWLPRSLRQARDPAKAILCAYLLAFAGSILLSLALEGFLSLLPGPTPPREVPEFGQGLRVFFGLVIFAPIIETLIMGAVLSALLRIVSPAAAIVVSAVGWGIAHSLVVPTWGLVIWWPFLIFSTLFVVWKPTGWGRAALMVSATHALQNLLPALLILFVDR